MDVPQVRRTGWPEGLSDEEAIQRLRTLCLGACDGIQDLADDSRYKALRRALLDRSDLRALVPAFVAAQPNLPAYVRDVREIRDRTERREMVRTQFAPLLEEVGVAPRADSSGWTGRATARERAAVVLALAPAALEAVERMIDDEARSRDNGGPVEDHREEALTHLRMLHQALGELLDAARLERPLGEAMDTLGRIRRSASLAVGRAAATMPIAASAIGAFAGVVGISELLLGNLVISIAAGALAGGTVKDAMLRKDA